MKYSVLILEDDKRQQKYLSDLLRADFPDFEIIKIASTVSEARAFLDKETPDLSFMDVIIPPDTSFDLLHSLPAIPFEIIFTTSFEEYAVKAFRLAAIDYLVKPIDPGELGTALEKFREKKSVARSDVQIRNLLSNLLVRQSDHSKIALPTLTGFIFVAVKDIVRCESDNTYTTFFTHDKRKIIVSKTLKECEQMLSEYRFFRVHNSHLINMEFIIEYIKGEGGIVKMSDGSQIDVSRRRKEEFLLQLKRN